MLSGSVLCVFGGIRIEMTVRESLLRSLRCREVERMPFCFLVDNFNYPAGTPAEFLDPLDIVAMQRWLGGALTERVGPAVTVRKNRLVRYTQSQLDGGVTSEEWESAKGVNVQCSESEGSH